MCYTVCVCVCVKEREGETGRQTDSQTDRQSERDRQRERREGGGTKNRTLGYAAEQGGRIRMTTLDKDGPRTRCPSVRF